MKKYDFRIEKLSLSADKSIKRKLYFMSYKKKFLSLFDMKNLKIALPAFALAIFAIGFFNSSNMLQNKTNIGTTNTNISQTISEKKDYRSIAKNRVLKAKMNYYKKYSALRKAKSLAVR